MSRLRDWRLKALAQGIFSILPRGGRLNYALTRHITKTYPASDASLEADRRIVRRHLENLGRFGASAPGRARCFEFGAGWDLAIPLLMAANGVSCQTVVDITDLVRDDLVVDIARRLGLEASGRSDLPMVGIEYIAPVDVSDTGLSTGSFDLIASTNTLEHVPEKEIPPLLDECHRLLAPGGICSFRIDYADHYHYFDTSVGQFNFLRYSGRTWRAFNSKLHFQNRLRHADYLRLFADAGFVVLDDRAWTADAAQIAVLRGIRLAPQFRDVPIEQLGIVGSTVVLARSDAHLPAARRPPQSNGDA